MIVERFACKPPKERLATLLASEPCSRSTVMSPVASFTGEGSLGGIGRGGNLIFGQNKVSTVKIKLF